MLLLILSHLNICWLILAQFAEALTRQLHLILEMAASGIDLQFRSAKPHFHSSLVQDGVAGPPLDLFSDLLRVAAVSYVGTSRFIANQRA